MVTATVAVAVRSSSKLLVMQLDPRGEHRSERVSKSRLVFVVVQGLLLVKAVAGLQHIQATLLVSSLR